MGAEDREPAGGRCHGPAAKAECQPVDGLFQRRRLGPRVGFAQVPQQQRKLVAAEPPDHVGGTTWRSSTATIGLEHLIARGVPEGVVDRLQAIDVEHDQRAAGVIALDIGDRAMEFAFKAAPVGNIQQEVDIRGSLQLLDSRRALASCNLSRRMASFASSGGRPAVTTRQCLELAPARLGAAFRAAAPLLRRFTGLRPRLGFLFPAGLFRLNQGLPEFTKTG